LDSSELVVLVDERGAPVGTAAKAAVHHHDTPLHLGFSCYLFDAGGRFLLTRRAAGKATFPGLWTNSCCGHPGPGESLVDAAARRARFELGLEPTGLRVVLPDFRYRAEQGGVAENEFCPVLVGRVDGEPAANPDEVMDHRWVDWRAFLDGDRPELSPWCVEQLERLRERPDLPPR
jgi:isopentenyl-diphosphate delta-isomerase